MFLVLVESVLMTALVALALHVPAGATGSHLHSAGLPATAATLEQLHGRGRTARFRQRGAAGRRDGGGPLPLSRTGWTASASDEETTRVSGQASNVLDGSATTMWHSRWYPAPAAALPHTITIDTKATRSIGGLRYLPRSDGKNGRVGSFEIRVSTNGTTWSAPVARGTLPDSGTEKTVSFIAVSARYVRLIATSEAGNRGPWSSAAEINLLAGQTVSPTGVLPRTGWTASASDAGGHPY